MEIQDLTTRFIAGISALAALCSLWLSYRIHNQDKPDLIVDVKYKKWSTKEIPEMHPHLTIILKNKGKRLVNIISIDLLLFPDKIQINNVDYKVSNFKYHLYDARKEGIIKLESGMRHELVLEPASSVPDPNRVLSIVEVVDALDHSVKFKVS